MGVVLDGPRVAQCHVRTRSRLSPSAQQDLFLELVQPRDTQAIHQA